MKKVIIVLPVLLIVASCGPSEGELWRNEDRQTVKIEDVGPCGFLYRVQEARNARADTSLPKKVLYKEGLIARPAPLYSDSSVTCVGYKVKEYHTVYKVDYTRYMIEEAEHFVNTHTPVE